MPGGGGGGGSISYLRRRNSRRGEDVYTDGREIPPRYLDPSPRREIRIHETVSELDLHASSCNNENYISTKEDVYVCFLKHGAGSRERGRLYIRADKGDAAVILRSRTFRIGNGLICKLPQ